MIDDFLLRAGLAGAAIALAAGPLGCFVIWRRMAYFGDATAHAALLGVALALLLDAAPTFGVLATALAMALAVSALSARGHTMDATLGVMAHAGLAVGLVAISLLSGIRVNLDALLFGDILAIGWSDLTLIWGGALAVTGLLAWRWSALLTSTLNVELASSAGLRPAREQLVLTLALALTVALALNVVGALLIAAMLVIPAATARSIARTPEAMAAASIATGLIAVGTGLAASLHFDTPAGPSIITAAATLYALSLLRRRP